MREFKRRAKKLRVPVSAFALEVVIGDVHIDSFAPAPVPGFLNVYVTLAPGEMPPDLAGWQVAVDLVAPGGEVSFVAPYAEVPVDPEHPALVSANFVADFAGGK